ncbi:hypothetical protein PIROE2DRAFT_10418 [Piromyces sp. E2]|nr:hypothetical protein PIROE2DRAFT_10418 [Piromyces sp. E2]|eukprot:OUM63110.1 hypothetical protein PIROE2DRAFT_10418 [Piromyces sp. E2]
MKLLPLLYYIYVYIIFKKNDFSSISDKSVCGGDEECLSSIKQCNIYYIDNFNEYSLCVKRKVFGKEINFPNEEEYIKSFYKASVSSASFEAMQYAYFKFILDILKLSIYDNQFSNLVAEVRKSIYIDFNYDVTGLSYDLIKDLKENIQNELKLDLSYEGIKEIANEFNYHDNYNLENNSDFESFYSTLNKKYFDNKVSNDDIEFLINHLKDYNLEMLLSNSNIDETSLSEFNKKFLINYDDTLAVDDIMRRMEVNEISSHNIFDMIYSIYEVLDMDNEIRYVYNESDKTMSQLDYNSIYENSESISEAIYNLIYDYYQYIYSVSERDNESENYYFTYYYNNDKIYYRLLRGDTLSELRESNFYNSIYNTIISIYSKNENNLLLKKCVKIVEELFKYCINTDYKLSDIKRYEKKINTDINYHNDIDESFDITFKENTFLYLIENESQDLYLNDLKNYITEVCTNYNNDQSKYLQDVISVMEIESYYNNIHEEYLTNSSISNYDYDELIEERSKLLIETLEDEDIIKNVKSYMEVIYEYVLITDPIYEDLLVKYDSLNKRFYKRDGQVEIKDIYGKVFKEQYVVQASEDVKQQREKMFINKRFEELYEETLESWENGRQVDTGFWNKAGADLTSMTLKVGAGFIGKKNGSGDSSSILANQLILSCAFNGLTGLAAFIPKIVPTYKTVKFNIKMKRDKFGTAKKDEKKIIKIINKYKQNSQSKYTYTRNVGGKEITIFKENSYDKNINREEFRNTIGGILNKYKVQNNDLTNEEVDDIIRKTIIASNNKLCAAQDISTILDSSKSEGLSAEEFKKEMDNLFEPNVVDITLDFIAKEGSKLDSINDPTEKKELVTALQKKLFDKNEKDDNDKLNNYLNNNNGEDFKKVYNAILANSENKESDEEVLNEFFRQNFGVKGTRLNPVNDDFISKIKKAFKMGCKRGSLIKKKRALFGCSKCHEKRSEEKYTEKESSENAEKVNNQKINVLDDYSTHLENALTKIKKVTNDKNILPNDQYDESDPSSVYENASSFDDAFDKLMDKLDEKTNDDATLSNDEVMNDIVGALESIKQCFDSVDGNAANNNDPDNSKTKKMKRLRIKSNYINQKIQNSNVKDEVKEKLSTSAKPIPSIDYTKSEEKQTENEQNVIVGIKDVMGESKLTLEMDGDKFTPNIDANSISEGATDYVDALNKLADRIEVNGPLLASNPDKLKSIADTLHSTINWRNGLSSNPLITKALNKVYSKVYDVAKKEGITLNSPMNEDHIAINEDDNNVDPSQTKLTINKGEPDKTMDNIFSFTDEDGHYVKGNIKLITNTLERDIEDSVNDFDKQENVMRRTNKIMSSMKSSMKELARDINGKDNEEINRSLDEVDTLSEIYDTYASLGNTLEENGIENSYKIEDDFNVFKKDSKAHKILSTYANMKMIKMLQGVKQVTKDNSILPFDGKYDGNNPSFNSLDNYANSLEAREIINRQDFQAAVDAVDAVYSILGVAFKVMNSMPFFNVMKKVIISNIRDTSNALTASINSKSPLLRTPEEHAMVEHLSMNGGNEIDNSNTESYDEIVYDSFVGTLEMIKAENNDDRIVADKLDSDDDDGNNVGNDIEPGFLVRDCSTYDEVANYIRGELDNMDSEKSKSIQNHLNNKIKNLSKKINNSIDTLSKEDISTATTKLANMNAMLPDSNNKKESNEKAVNNIRLKNQKNQNKGDDKLQKKLRRIRRRRKTKKNKGNKTSKR